MIEENSTCVQTHLGILQGVIQRMASNSASCKTWCITMVSAIIVVIADKGKPQYSLIAILPIFLFFLLDTYYLALEKGFRNSYNELIEKIHKQILTNNDLFVVKPIGEFYKLFFKSIISLSIWVFYLTLFIMIFLIKWYIL